MADGGESEDEESIDDLDRLEQTEFPDERSPSQEAKESVEKVEEPAGTRRGVAQKVKSRGRKKRKQESEEEDGEASPSPAASLDADGIDESEGEADVPAEEDDAPLYPLEGKFVSSSDRAHVMSLPEIERESILAERAEEVSRRQQDLQLRKQLQRSQAAANKHKRKAAAAELDDGTRRSTRPKTEKASALDNYRRAREQKGAERRELESGRDRRDERSPSSASDRDADGESEVEWAEPTTDRRRDDPPAELRDFERTRVGRSNFSKVCFYPGFEDAIRGCFARVSIGLNRETGQNQYRMTQIRGFTEGKPYQLETSLGKKFTTDQYAIVAHGKAEKPWPFSACSDSKFTDAEYQRFQETLTKDNMRQPSRKFLYTKVDAINALIDQKFTEQTLQEKFAKQRAMEQKYNPAHIAKQKRSDIQKRRAEAEDNGDEEEVARCDAELQALENSASNANGAVKISSGPAKPTMQHDRLAQLNHKNRSKNQQEVRNALIAERNRIKKEREEIAKAAKAMAEAEANAVVKAEKKETALKKAAMKDLFGEGSDTSRAGTPATGVDTPKKKSGTSTPLNGVKGPIGALKKKNLEDDVIGGLDLGIDIEI
ncbi:hypothetical protein M409DRAFT_64883 [Zasmidium cellare ATCC 36951]|uniref:Plus3 domain-containing protein n=1 Tax=Zasmidium cellare ATCC 36951 TaxID=1080233 RepID=A0A6A6CP97_ZASCE|nr:uncharacterized protein M409DRAFT_64883 [Zasmidium cellare ATCC 36951]KAF2169097.1 hypothetical protein M409DRAFT_64883 [Zasmidium cellare ATCC 36951]